MHGGEHDDRGSLFASVMAELKSRYEGELRRLEMELKLERERAEREREVVTAERLAKDREISRLLEENRL